MPLSVRLAFQCIIIPNTVVIKNITSNRNYFNNPLAKLIPRPPAFVEIKHFVCSLVLNKSLVLVYSFTF